MTRLPYRECRISDFFANLHHWLESYNMDKIKVIIADDSDFVRDGMKIILDVDDEFEVIGTAGTGSFKRGTVCRNSKNQPEQPCL